MICPIFLIGRFDDFGMCLTTLVEMCSMYLFVEKTSKKVLEGSSHRFPSKLKIPCLEKVGDD